jgi:hypothetical protein
MVMVDLLHLLIVEKTTIYGLFTVMLVPLLSPS